MKMWRVFSRTLVLNIEGELWIEGTETFERVDDQRFRGVQKMLA